MPAGTRRYPSTSKTASPDNPIYERAKLLADTLYERAKKLAEAMAPEHPADTEALPEYDQFMILQQAALHLTPEWWDNPDALEDLYRFRQKFLGIEDKGLKEIAKQLRKEREKLPNPRITPQSPEWDERAGTWGVD
ncbi:MAG: hypothetical protein ACOC5K_01080 [Chloroflexota bacterium]